MLNHTAVLVAEDQPFIALDIALAIEDAGGEVVGPAASVKEALALLATNKVAAAILDVNLVDGDCSAVVEVLAGINAPMILQTGVGLPPALATRFPKLIVHIKPCIAAKLVAQLESLIADRPPLTGYGSGLPMADRVVGSVVAAAENDEPASEPFRSLVPDSN